jgi:hypothetical protein
MNKLRKDQWSVTLESLDPEDQLLWRTTKWVMRAQIPSLPGTPGAYRSLGLEESQRSAGCFN